MAADGQITLPVAAQRLGVSYERAKRMLLTGRLDGEQIAGRFWVVDVKSVERARDEAREQLASA